MENNRIKKEYSKKTIVEIGGAEFTIGVSQNTEDSVDRSLALKVVIYGMDSLETADIVLERMLSTLVDIDPQLEMAELKYDKAAMN